jgi:hypothetical protein
MMTACWSGICSTTKFDSIAAEIDALLITLTRLRYKHDTQGRAEIEVEERKHMIVFS